jgi:hypothetical protein
MVIQNKFKANNKTKVQKKSNITDKSVQPIIKNATFGNQVHPPLEERPFGPLIGILIIIAIITLGGLYVIQARLNSNQDMTQTKQQLSDDFQINNKHSQKKSFKVIDRSVVEKPMTDTEFEQFVRQETGSTYTQEFTEQPFFDEVDYEEEIDYTDLQSEQATQDDQVMILQ